MDRVLLVKYLPRFSRYLMWEFLKALTEVSIAKFLGLFVTFGSEKFRRD